MKLPEAGEPSRGEGEPMIESHYEPGDPNDPMWTCTECGERFEGPPEHDFPVLCDECWEAARAVREGPLPWNKGGFLDEE